MTLLGSDPLLQLLYETDIPSEMIDITQLQDIPAVWRYRARISVDHLTQMLNSSQQQCPVLSIFLEEVLFNLLKGIVFSLITLKKSTTYYLAVIHLL